MNSNKKSKSIETEKLDFTNSKSIQFYFEIYIYIFIINWINFKVCIADSNKDSLVIHNKPIIQNTIPFETKIKKEEYLIECRQDCCQIEIELNFDR